MDLFGHVNNVNYFKYIQASRVNYWEQLGLIDIFEEQKTGPILASTSCNFKKPLFYPGELTIQASIAYIKNSSFSIVHQILNSDNEICAEATDVIVMFDFNKHEKISFPAKYREAAEKLEGKIL